MPAAWDKTTRSEKAKIDPQDTPKSNFDGFSDLCLSQISPSSDMAAINNEERNGAGRSAPNIP